jgi:predicted Ser/Thr protein kinase
MATCAACSAFVPDGSKYCPLCGTPVGGDATRVSPGSGQPPDDDTRAPAVPGALTPDMRPASASHDVYTAGTLLANRYRVVGLLGKGGMGEVYRADDLTLGQPVALKFLPRSFERDPRRLGQLLDEIRAARAVSHPAVCRVYDVGAADGRHFLSMEYIDGEDLASSLRRIGRFPIDKALEIARQLCAGLSAVHEKGLLHRDLKPANVMLDGRGKVRLTDFGLAGELESRPGGGEVAGTPAYMAPEQLAGGPASVQTDIYALGLVLYEVFTGRRAFEAPTIAGLRAKQQQETPALMSSSAAGIDPSIEEAILRCLAPDPSRRPTSALLVSALLPGGDPLAAALAAGETPSPAMVAAAGQHHGISQRVALACLGAIGVLLAIVLAFVNGYGFTHAVPLAYSPDVLENKAQEIIRRFGYTEAPGDSARGLTWNQEYIQWVTQNVPEKARFDAMRRGREAGILFWYRTSPKQIMAQNFFAAGLATGRVSEDDPPFRLARETRVWLTSSGRLMRFERIPLEMEPPEAAPPPMVDWRPAFEAAELDPAWFSTAEPEWAPQAWGDSRTAWTGKRPGGTQVIRVEAASWRGKPISFRLIAPWTKAERQESTRVAQNPVTQAVGLTFILALAIGAVVLARRNIELERSDRRGASRLAWFVFVFTLIAWALEADHITVLAEMLLLIMAVSSALFASGLVWVLYVALEPYVRRRWPHTIITWNRLLAGHWRDPLVGRDLLVGLTYGLVQCALAWTGIVLVRHFGPVDPVPMTPALDPLLATRYIMTTGFGLLYSSMVSALGVFVLLFLLRIALRREWLAVSVFVAIVVGANVSGSSVPWAEGPLGLLVVGVALTALLRFGLVAYIVGNVAGSSLTAGFPLATDPSQWYTGPTVVVMVGVIGAALYAYRLATPGAKPGNTWSAPGPS